VVEIVERLRGLKNGWVTSQSFSEFIDKAADALESMMRRVDAMRWRPIETAPKDQWIMAWDEDGGHALLKHNPFFEMAGEDGDGWMGATHWQPLPEPPRAGIEEK
jgi:hypothetical protein